MTQIHKTHCEEERRERRKWRRIRRNSYMLNILLCAVLLVANW